MGRRIAQSSGNKSGTGGGSLLDEIRSGEVPHKRNAQWILLLPPDTRKEFEDIRDAYRAGELPGWTVQAIYERARERGMFGNHTVVAATFRRWMNGTGG